MITSDGFGQYDTINGESCGIVRKLDPEDGSLMERVEFNGVAIGFSRHINSNGDVRFCVVDENE